jgi:hypothetical protein
VHRVDFVILINISDQHSGGLRCFQIWTSRQYARSLNSSVRKYVGHISNSHLAPEQTAIRDTPVDITPKIWNRTREIFVWIQAVTWEFLNGPNIQICPGAHQTSYTICVTNYLPADKMVVGWIWLPHLHLASSVKVAGSIRPFPLIPSWRVLGQIHTYIYLNTMHILVMSHNFTAFGISYQAEALHSIHKTNVLKRKQLGNNINAVKCKVLYTIFGSVLDAKLWTKTNINGYWNIPGKHECL